MTARGTITLNKSNTTGTWTAEFDCPTATTPAQRKRPRKRLVVYQGKGTPYEKRIDTGIWLYWSDTLQHYCSIPDEVKD